MNAGHWGFVYLAHSKCEANTIEFYFSRNIYYYELSEIPLVAREKPTDFGKFVEKNSSSPKHFWLKFNIETKMEKIEIK